MSVLLKIFYQQMRNSDPGESSFYDMIKSSSLFIKNASTERHHISAIFGILILVDASTSRILASPITNFNNAKLQDLGPDLSSSSVGLKYNDAYEHNT